MHLQGIFLPLVPPEKKVPRCFTVYTTLHLWVVRYVDSANVARDDDIAYSVGQIAYAERRYIASGEIESFEGAAKEKYEAWSSAQWAGLAPDNSRQLYLFCRSASARTRVLLSPTSCFSKLSSCTDGLLASIRAMTSWNFVGLFPMCKPKKGNCYIDLKRRAFCEVGVTKCALANAHVRGVKIKHGRSGIPLLLQRR